LGYIIDKKPVDRLVQDDEGNIFVPTALMNEEMQLIMRLTLDNHISKSDAELFLKVFQNPINEPGEDETDFFGGDNDGMDETDKKAHSEEAKRKAKQALENMGFDTSGWFDNYTYVLGVIDPNGLEREIIVKSAKAGNLYINPDEWVKLNQPNAMLLVYDGKKVQPVSFEELFAKGKRFHISVLAESFTPEGVASFGEVFRYVPGVTFVIESPNFSYANWFDSFGLYQTKDGEAAENEDDFLD
jgi:hypothetical protein